MHNSASTIIIVVLAGILLFIVPLVTLADRQDNVTQENVKLIVEEFVTDIRNTGQLTRTKYQDFVNKLYSTGSNTYEIEMEIHVLDENPGKKNMQTNYTKIGENVYVIYYDTQILPRIGITANDEVISTEEDTITLKQGDKIYVEVRNENSTTAQTLKKTFLSFSNEGEYVISANSSGMVTVNGEGIIAEKVSEEEMQKYEYKITYDANGGTGGLASQGKSYGKDIIITNAKPTNKGYNFLGWSTNPSSQEVTYKPGDIFSINANITLYAVWEIKTFKIIYNANGGVGAPETQIKTYDIDLKLSSVMLTRTGYTFLGWSTNSEDKTALYQPESMFKVNENTVLYAIWKPHTYTISYNANGGINAPDSQIKTHDVTLTLSSVQPTRTGYTFLGWNTNASATSVEYLPGATFTTESNTILYAVWKINTFTITYDANGGTGAPSQQIKVYGVDLVLSLIEPTRTGYTFLGWSISDSATSVDYPSGGTFKINADTRLYAVWEINTYIIKYDANKGSGEPVQQIKTYGIDLILSSTVPTRTGYTFLGWSKSSTESTPSYNPGATFVDNNDTTLYAVWRINTYIITYDANGGSGAPESQTKIYDTNLTLSSTKPIRDGYTFLGWNTSKTADTAAYNPGDAFTINNNVTLYAIWDLNKYTISYNANGGSGEPAPQIKMHDIDLTLSSTKPTRTGYTFLGWSTNKNATTPTYLARGTLKVNINTTLYAIWEINTYTITYNSNGGSGAPGSQMKTYGVNLTLSSIKPTRDGYTFLGWSTSSTASTATYQPGSSFTINENTTLFAVWKLNTYIITYDANGGSGAPSVQTKTHGVTLTLSSTKPTRNGYTFLGWSTSSSATYATYAAGGSFTTNANTTLYAVWQVATYTVTYNRNGGTGTNSSVSYNIGTSATLKPSTTFTPPSGKHFLHWNTKADGTGTSYNAGATYTSNKSVILYAIWEINTYTISYNGNGSTGGSTASSIHTYGVAKKLTANGFTKTGHTFAGWATSASGSVVYSNQQSVTNLSSTNGATVTLYAKWTADTYTVAFNANGGSGAPSAQTKTYGVNLTLSSTKPTRSGYTFQGWGITSTTTTVSYQPGGTYTANSGITLYAVWKVNKTTVATTNYYAFKSNLTQNLSAGTIQVYNMNDKETPPLNKVTGTGQDSWKNITVMGPLSSSFTPSYSYDTGDDGWLWDTSQGAAAVGTVPYYRAHIRGTNVLSLSNTYNTNGNTNLLIGGGLYRISDGAPGHTYLRLTVTNADTGATIYNKQVYHGYSINYTAGGVAVVEDINISSASRVTVKITAESEGWQSETNGHDIQVYFSDIIFYGGTN